MEIWWLIFYVGSENCSTCTYIIYTTYDSSKIKCIFFGLILTPSGIPEAEIFGRKRKFSAIGLRFRPPNLKAEYGRKSNFRIFSKWTVKLETIVDILVGQIEARLNENESKPNESGVNLNFEKSMANIIRSQSKTQNDTIDDDHN